MRCHYTVIVMSDGLQEDILVQQPRRTDAHPWFGGPCTALPDWRMHPPRRRAVLGWSCTTALVGKCTPKPRRRGPAQRRTKIKVWAQPFWKQEPQPLASNCTFPKHWYFGHGHSQLVTQSEEWQAVVVSKVRAYPTLTQQAFTHAHCQ